MSLYKASLLLCGIIFILIGYLLLLHTPQLLAYASIGLGGTLVGTILGVRSRLKEIPHASIEDELELFTCQVLLEQLPEITKDELSAIQTMRKQLPPSTDRQLLTYSHAKLLGQAKFKNFPHNVSLFVKVIKEFKCSKELKVKIGNVEVIDI